MSTKDPFELIPFLDKRDVLLSSAKTSETKLVVVSLKTFLPNSNVTHGACVKSSPHRINAVLSQVILRGSTHFYHTTQGVVNFFPLLEVGT